MESEPHPSLKGNNVFPSPLGEEFMERRNASSLNGKTRLQFPSPLGEEFMESIVKGNVGVLVETFPSPLGEEFMESLTWVKDI